MDKNNSTRPSNYLYSAAHMVMRSVPRYGQRTAERGGAENGWHGDSWYNDNSWHDDSWYKDNSWCHGDSWYNDNSWHGDSWYNDNSWCHKSASPKRRQRRKESKLLNRLTNSWCNEGSWHNKWNQGRPNSDEASSNGHSWCNKWNSTWLDNKSYDDAGSNEKPNRWQTEDQWQKLSAHLCDEHVELWECLGALERRGCEMDSEIKNFQDRRRKLAAAVDVLAEASTAKTAAEAKAVEEHKEPCGEHVKLESERKRTRQTPSAESATSSGSSKHASRSGARAGRGKA